MSTTQVGTHTVFYDDLGAGHPLLFLTGLAAPRSGWWKQLEPFSRKFRVINMDNRDAGESFPDKGPYLIADMAEDVAGLIMHLNLGPTHIIGISMGGMIALELTIHHPQLVDKLVLVSTTAGGPESVGARSEILSLLVSGSEEDAESSIRRTYTAIAGEGYMAAHPQELDRIVSLAMVNPMSEESYQRQLMACLAHYRQGVADQLAQIDKPTFVVHGDYDPLIPYPNGKYLSEQIRGARFSSYLGVGHLPIIEASERFNREVLEFLG